MDILNDSCEDMFLTQNSFHPPVDDSVDTQVAADAVDSLLNFDESSENDKGFPEGGFWDFTYQVDNGTCVADSQACGNVNSDDNIIPLISDLHLDNNYQQV